MTVIQIKDFTGIAPRWSNRLLANNAAVAAENAKLLSGELRGFHETQLLYDFNPSSPPNPIQRAFRLPQSVAAPIPIGSSDTWIGFPGANVDFVRTPVLEDSFERYYWTGDSSRLSGAPQYNTRSRINARSTSYQLGVPTPVNAPSISAPAGTNLSRAYVYTFVSAYGEEGPPSPATLGTGSSGTWTIGNFDTSIPSAANYNITTVRIYRTVPGATSSEYYWVADISLGTTTYSDTASDTTVASNFTMPSLTWTPPPATLEGIVAHPGGFLVGFSGRDLWMSEPYHPHAWPVQYVQTCQTEIVGVAIFGNVIAVMTTSHPYYAEGMSPLNITLQKIDSVDPCVSRRSIATTMDGVYYSSPQGIVKHIGGATQLVTRQLFTREEWQNFFSPTTVYAVSYGVEYISFDTTSTGFIFSPSDQSTPLTTLDRFSNVTAIQQDAYSGDVYIIQNNQVRLWDPPKSTPYFYTWTSKEFDLPKPVNFGAFRIKFAPSVITIPASELKDYTTYNTERYLPIVNQLAPTTALTGGTLAAGTYYYLVSAITASGESRRSVEKVITTGKLAAPVQNAATTSTTGGTLAAGTYYYVITALGNAGETIASNEVSITTTGTTSSNTISWAAVTGASGYRVYRGTAAGAENVYYAPGNVTSYVDTGAASTAGSPPVSNTATTNTNTVTLNWQAYTGATGYRVYRGTSAGGENVYYAPGNVVSYTDTGAAATGATPPMGGSMLAPINSRPVNGVRTLKYPGTTAIVGYAPPPELRGAVNGSSLYNIGQYTNQSGGVVVTIKARDLTSSWYTIYQSTILSEGTYRLPSGIKADAWQITLVGNVPVYSFTMAETGKELKQA